jgi:hypothetical protein
MIHTLVFTEPERILLAAIIVAGALQWVKMFVPLLNGWAAGLANALLSLVALGVVFRPPLTWNAGATAVLIGLAAAGVHGTVTKLSDYPSPHQNPTPSGTPAQNYNRIDMNIP